MSEAAAVSERQERTTRASDAFPSPGVLPKRENSGGRPRPQYVFVSALPEEGYVRLPQILAVYPISKSGWWAGVKTGIYPPGVKLSPRCTAWRVEDIRRLLEAKQRTAQVEAA